MKLYARHMRRRYGLHGSGSGVSEEYDVSTGDSERSPGNWCGRGYVGRAGSLE
ncbi:MAG: hypothetical protein NVS4B8_30590 [Herpetosiphon sp.]